MHDSREFNSRDGGGGVTNKTETCNKKVTNVTEMLRKKSKWQLPIKYSSNTNHYAGLCISMIKQCKTIVHL